MADRKSQDRLQLALESASMMAWEWDLDSGAVRRTGNFAEIFSCGEIAENGRDTDLLNLIHPEDRSRVLRTLDQARKDGEPYYCEYRLLLSDFSVRWVIDRGRAEGATEGRSRRMYGVLMDITPRRRAEEEVRAAEAALRRHDALVQRMLDGFPNGSVNVFDRELRYVLAAGMGLRQVGLSPEMLVGKRLEEVFPPDAVAFVRPFYELAFAGQSLQFELAMGTETFLLNAGPLLEEDRTVIRIVVVAQNISLQKQAEEVLLSQAQELARSNADLQQFAFVASHDLQEPLRTITAFTELLAKRYRGSLDADADELLTHISGGAKRMSSLLSALLEYSRAASPDSVEFSSVDLDLIVQRAKMNLSAMIDDTGAVVQADSLPAVLGDEFLLTQLFQNLMVNGIKYRGAEVSRIHVRSETRQERTIFSVGDNGAGIDSQHLESIFGVFKRLHGHEIPGAGIGLAICKRIVEKHGGQIWAESDGLGKGATFFFTLGEGRP